MNIEEYDLSTKVWSGKSNLREPRYELVVCTDSCGYAYAIGGRRSVLVISKRRSSAATNSNALLADLPTPGIGPAASYCAKNTVSKLPVATVKEAYRFDPSTASKNISNNEWSHVANMRMRRSHLAAAWSGDDLYLAGGCDSGYSQRSAVTSVEIFNVCTGKVRSAPELREACYSCCATTI